ncbi:MAG: hypothetical protein LUC31_01205 [Coprobacillus sp.]|nr:hypothetical protein [Coprobacillus sp.]
MKTKKLASIIGTSFFVLVCACACNASASNTSISAPAYSNEVNVYADDSVIRSNPDDDEPEPLFPGHEDATAISEEYLTVKVSTATKTPTSQSYTATLATETTIYTGIGTDSYVYVALDEPTDLLELPTNSSGDEDQIPIYTAYVYNVVAGNGQVVIPYRCTYGTRAILSVESIGPEIIDDDAIEGLEYIVIPETITLIDEDAFTNLEGCGVTFYVLMNENEVEFDKSVFPSDAIVEYGINQNSNNHKSIAIATTKSDSKETNFFVGSEASYSQYGVYPSDTMEIGLQYDVYVDGVYDRTQFNYFPVSSNNRNYDGIGEALGQTSLVLYFDMDLEENESVDNNSLIFFNIYFASYDSLNGGYYPDLNYPFVVDEETGEVEQSVGQLYVIPQLAIKIDDDITNYITYDFNSLNTFSGFTTFVMNVSVPDTNIYETLKASTYNANIANIENGTLQVRYRFTSLSTAYYRLTYEDSSGDLVTTEIKIDTPVAYHKINTKKNNEICFLIKNKDVAPGFNASKVRGLDIRGLRITLDLYNKKLNSIVSKSSVESRFGLVNVMQETLEKPSVINFNTILGIIAAGYTVLYFIIALVYYFWAKNKYKNDEFRRMDTKRYIKRAVGHYIWIGILVFATVLIGFRSVPLNNAVVTFNPIDPWVFAFSVGAIIAVGYYIRYFWIMGRSAKKRKEIIRLRLNEDEEDDGTQVDQQVQQNS